MTTIVNFKWGEVTTKDTRGCIQLWKDCVITANGPEVWDWRADGTRHRPGVTLAAVKKLDGCQQIIVSQGVEEQLCITVEAKEYLDSRPIPYYILDSNRAVKKYAELLLKSSGPIGLLLHSTC